MVKDYGVISTVPTTNKLIYDCFADLTEADQRRFVSNFKDEADTDKANDTLHELVCGVFVARQGYEAQYNPKLDGKTPEWLMTHRETGARLLLELVNFHASAALQGEKRKSDEAGEMSFAYFMEPNTGRLYDRLQDKMSKYGTLVEKYDLHYVVGVFSLFLPGATLDEMDACLNGDAALFPQYPSVSGVLFFRKAGSEYHFDYIPNPGAKRKALQIGNGTLKVTQVRDSRKHFLLYDREEKKFRFVHEELVNLVCLYEERRYREYGVFDRESDDPPTFSPSQLADALTWAVRHGKRCPEGSEYRPIKPPT